MSASGSAARRVHSKALWSEKERVWLGSKTFLDWSMSIENIDIPWVVAQAAGAPADDEELREAVLAELNSYWANRLAELPSKALPNWLPLP